MSEESPLYSNIKRSPRHQSQSSEFGFELETIDNHGSTISRLIRQVTKDISESESSDYKTDSASPLTDESHRISIIEPPPSNTSESIHHIMSSNFTRDDLIEDEPVHKPVIRARRQRSLTLGESTPNPGSSISTPPSEEPPRQKKIHNPKVSVVTPPSEELLRRRKRYSSEFSITTPPSEEPPHQKKTHNCKKHRPSHRLPSRYNPPAKDPSMHSAISNTENIYSEERDINPPKPCGNGSYEQRRIALMENMRMELIKQHNHDVALARPVTFQDRYVNAFSKGLPHDEEGFVDPDEMKKLLAALKDHDLTKLTQVRLGSSLKLVNPSAAWANDIIGSCSNTYRFSSPPSLSSDRIASEMSELYCMALARDVPFRDYDISTTIEDCCGYLNSLQRYSHVSGRVTPYNIFRGPMYGDLQGPYISQFLYRDIKMGGFIQKQLYATDLEGSDYMKTWDNAITAQDGIITETLRPPRTTPRYIITGRDLACYVHLDEPYQAFLNACVLLIDLKVPMNTGITSHPVEGYFVNLGRADIQSILTIAGRSALLAAWYVKWSTLFLRPEALGIEVERVYRDNCNVHNIAPELLRNPVIEAVRSRNGNALLRQAYPEGAPLHPSMPSGHAAIAGACVTVLKFFFDTGHELDVYEPNENGTELIKTGRKTTVGDELDKLASNMSIGRNWAGIHYHMDAISGLKRGEKVAMSCLQELIRRYPQKISVSFPRFNGQIATIR